MKRLIYSAILLTGYFSFGQQNSVALDVIDISKTEGSAVSSFFISNNKLHFTANQSRDYRWLYNIDNDKLKFINKDNTNNLIKFDNSKAIQFDETRFILNGTKNYAQKIFITDGTQSNTIDLGAFLFNDQDHVKLGNKLYFLVRNNGNEYFLYETDGTTLGTKKVSVTDNVNFSNFNSLKVVANELHFITTINSKDYHYKIDSNQNLVQITNFDNLKINDFVKVNNKWFYNISSTYNTDKILICENGICSETLSLIKNNSPSNTKFLVLDENLLFIETKSINWSNYQSKVYKYNSSNDLFETINIDNNEMTNEYLNFRKLFKFKNEWYIVTEDNNAGRIYKYRNSGLVHLVSTDPIISDFYFTSANFYFSVLDNNQDYRIFRSDGTAINSGILNEIGIVNSNDIITYNDELYFRKSDEINGDELWKYNEEQNETKFVKNINYRGSGNVDKLKSINNKVFFKGHSNKVYSINNSGEYTYHQSPEENYTYGNQTFYQINDDVILHTEGNNINSLSKLNPMTNNFEQFYSGEPFLIINPQILNNKLYFASNILSGAFNTQLHYIDPASNTINYVRNVNGLAPEKIGFSFKGVFLLNENYYYVSEDNNKGSISKLNLTNNTTEVVYRFSPNNYDDKQANIVANLNNRLVINYDHNYYLYDGTNMTFFTKGEIINYLSPNTFNSLEQPILNNKFYYTKSNPLLDDTELWITDGYNFHSLNTNLKYNSLLYFTNCNNKTYFVNSNLKTLMQTDGTANGTHQIALMENDYILENNILLCKNDKLFFVDDYYGNKISVIDNDIKKSFYLRFIDLPEMWQGYDYTKDITFTDNKLFLSINHYYAGAEVFMIDYNAFNLNTLSNQNFDINLISNKKGEITVYPNPTTRKVNIVVNNQEQIKQIKVVNVAGQTILNQNSHSNNNFYEIDLSSIKKGIYFLNITTNKSNYSNKLIKN